MKTLAQIIAHNVTDMHGYRWGRWTVVARGPAKWRGQKSRATWVCRCECGTEVVTSGTNIRSEKARAHIRCWRCDP